MTHRRSSHWRWGLKQALWPIAIAGGVAAILIGLPLLGNPEAINHLLNFKSVRGRLWMWVVTWAMIKGAPWGGHGLGTFGLQFPLYQAQTYSHERAAPFMANASFTSYAHNDYLQLWAEVGLLGLLAFGGLIWILLKRGRALADDPVALGCWAALISLLVNAAVAFPLHLPTSLMLFAVLLGAVEGAAGHKTIVLSLSAPPVRILILILAVIICLTAYRSSYHRLTADAALLRASAALEGHHWDEAEKAIGTAIDHAPTRLDGYSMLGRFHLEQGEYERALNALNQAMKLGVDVEVYDWKATALEHTGQRAAAIATLNELVWLRPDLSWPHQRLTTLKRVDGNQGKDKR
jgi:tetratricopeptide (TPR) repeat protein